MNFLLKIVGEPIFTILKKFQLLKYLSVGFPPLLNLSTRLSTAALPGQTTKMAQTLESMFQNVAYRPTVYRTGSICISLPEGLKLTKFPIMYLLKVPTSTKKIWFIMSFYNTT